MALKQLHGDKRPPFEFSDIVNGADAGMVQRGCCARFTPESLDGLRVLGYVFGEEFQGHISAQPRVFRPIDYPHASAAKLLEHGIVRDGPTDN
jgi:hypothetical protein